MSKNENFKKCPYCNSEKIGYGFQTNHAKMIPLDRTISSKSSDILAEICCQCGHILSLKVENPEYFIKNE